MGALHEFLRGFRQGVDWQIALGFFIGVVLSLPTALITLKPGTTLLRFIAAESTIAVVSFLSLRHSKPRLATGIVLGIIIPLMWFLMQQFGKQFGLD